MFPRQQPLVSLHDASRRLRVGVDVMWAWIVEGRLSAHVRHGRGFGMEYFLDPNQLRMAREIRDSRPPSESEDGDGDAKYSFPNTDNIIAFDFGDTNADAVPPESVLLELDTYERSSALIAMEKLRDDALAAIRRQAEREDAMLEMVDAVDSVLTATMNAMTRAQDVNLARLAAELESVRARLAGQVLEREEEDLVLQNELSRAKSELELALKDVDSNLGYRAPTSRTPLTAEATLADISTGTTD